MKHFLIVVFLVVFMGNSFNVCANDEVIKTGDQLTISIYPEDDYLKGGQVVVSEDGTITLPLVGHVEVAGKTIKQAQEAIKSSIDSDYLVNPVVVIKR